MGDLTRTKTTRDLAREAFIATGLSYTDLTLSDLRDLRDEIDAEMKSSGLIDGYEMREAIRTVDWPHGWAALTCRAYYFDKREAVTFNREGFIGFGGWADDKNIEPIVAGFTKWCAALASSEGRNDG